MTFSVPFTSDPLKISQDWCDSTGDLTNAYYNVMFDRGSDGAFVLMGMGPDYARQRRMSFYSAEVHVCYVRPLHVDDVVTVDLQILESDEKRIRYYQEIHHVDGWLAATSETMSLHVDLSVSKVVPFPPDILEAVNRMTAAHSALPKPDRAGKRIDIHDGP
jgi:acyl-CoA thioester hydrolase